MSHISVFIKLLKQYTNIDHDFIDTFFTKFKIGGDLDFHLKDKQVARYLGITLDTLRNRLSNKYSKKAIYIEKIDYIRVKTGRTSAVTYMINYQCFERLAMAGDTEKSETVRNYFVKLREFIVENHRMIYQTMTNKDHLEKVVGHETIYFFVADERNNTLIKVGSTKNIVTRLRNYNVGRVNEVDLRYLAIVKHAKLIENCIKLKLKKNQIYKNREIYEIDPKKLKKVIDNCYCKYVSKKENELMYDELSQLIALYGFVKNKVHVKPYIIINK